jgi:two-component system, sensor histidine kinase
VDRDIHRRRSKENPSRFRESSRTHALLEWTTDGFLALDHELRVTHFNTASEQSSGTSRTDALGKGYFEVCPQLQGSLVQRELTAALTTHTSKEFEYFHQHIRKWLLVRAYPTRTNGLWIFFHDITAQKQVLYETETAHQRTFEILESISDAFFAVDEEWRFTYINAPAEQVWRRKREQLLGKIIWDGFPNLVGTDFFLNLRRASGQRQRMRFIATLPTGRAIEVDTHPCAGGMCVYFRQLESSVVRRIRQSSRENAEQIVAAREEESQRIARELHDGAGQLVAALSVGIRALEDVRTMKEIKSRVRRLRTIATRTLDELTQLTHRLHGSVWREIGLLGALQRLASEISESHKLSVHLELEPLSELPLSLAAQESVYRIVQEALSNAVKHSKATRAEVAFRYRAPILDVKITDNGRGFNPQRLDATPGTHLGLRTMRERSEMLGGSLSIASLPRGGTRIIARVPVSKEKAA